MSEVLLTREEADRRGTCLRGHRHLCFKEQDECDGIEWVCDGFEPYLRHPQPWQPWE